MFQYQGGNQTRYRDPSTALSMQQQQQKTEQMEQGRLDHVSLAFDHFIQMGTHTLSDLQQQRTILKVKFFA